MIDWWVESKKKMWLIEHFKFNSMFPQQLVSAVPQVSTHQPQISENSTIIYPTDIAQEWCLLWRLTHDIRGSGVCHTSCGRWWMVKWVNVSLFPVKTPLVFLLWSSLLAAWQLALAHLGPPLYMTPAVVCAECRGVGGHMETMYLHWCHHMAYKLFDYMETLAPPH